MDWSWVVSWSRLMDWSWVVSWTRLMYWWSVMHRLVNWGWVIWSYLVYWSWSCVTFIRNVCDVSSIAISGIFYILPSSIGKKYTVTTINNTIGILIFSSLKVGSGIFVTHSVGIMIGLGLFVFWFMIFGL